MDKLISIKTEKDTGELEKLLQYYTDVAENTPVGIITCDENGNIRYVNSMAVKLLGSPSAEETKKINLFTFPLLCDCGFSDKLKHSIQTNTHINYEMNYESKWGRKIWLNIHNKPFLSGGEKQAIVIIDDLTERKKLESHLTSLSFTDALTGVYNRRYFKQKAEEEIELTKRLGRSFSVIMLDLDQFKNINDNFGHDVGDAALKTISHCIMEKIRKTDTLARWGGEEFVIILTDINRQIASDIAEKLRKRIMKTEIPIAGRVTASFGVTDYEDGDTVDDLIQRADRMLYLAKLEGRNCVKHS
jgi:diguanylate cyclase (GGDEF)-like protein/PAS domain S-box-containing protein